MSEPIQSIAQNNYILATQQEVSHDSSLSGNGTVDSPLGVSETVLWTGDSLADTAIQLSEAANNFEYIEIHAFWSGQGATMSVREDICSRFTPDTLNHSLSTIVPLGNSGYSNVYVACNVIKLANDYMSISSVLRFRSSLGGANPDTNDATRIVKVIGINRIANN